MKKALLSFAAATPALVASFLFQTTNPNVVGHVSKLQNAKSVMVEFTSQPIGGSVVAQSLQLSFPNKLRWESPTTLTVMDGKTAWTYDKASKTYTEEAVTPGWSTGKLGSGDAWLWSAFSDAKFADQIGSVKQGRARKVRGIDVVEHEITFSKRPGDSATLLFDSKLGVFRGAILKIASGSEIKESLILADKLELGSAPAADDLFAFAPPAGSKKAEAAPVASGAKFSEVSSIITANCSGCHGANGGRGGLNLSTYASIMSSRTVVAGSPAQSRMIMHMRGQRRIMPPSGKLPEATIAKVESWITAGAKND